MTPHVLAFDVGTSRIKFALVGPDGRSLSSGSVDANEEGRRGGELDPAHVWTSLIEIVRSLSEAERSCVTLVALTCQLATCFLDDRGNSVRDAITWQDQRAASQAADLRERFPAMEEMAKRPLAAERSVSILDWIREKEPQAFQRIAAVLHLKDYLNFRLTGQLTTDPVHAAYTGVFDVSEREFNKAILDQLKFSHINWGTLVGSCGIVGTLSPAAAQQLGLAQEVRVAGGAPDGSMASIAAGATSINRMSDIGGTSEVVFVCDDKVPKTSGSGLVVNPHPDGRQWLVGGPMSSTGLALLWVADLLGCSLDQLSKLAITSVPGARGVLFVPTLDGSRAPDWNPSARGAFVGLSLAHAPADLARAAYEGIAFSIRQILELCREVGCSIDSLFLAGGASKDPFFCQLKADCLAISAESAPTDELGICGTVACAWTAVRFHPTLSQAIAQLVSGNVQRYHADESLSSLYRARFDRWKQVSQLRTGYDVQ